MRETLSSALKKSDIVLIMGKDENKIASKVKNHPAIFGKIIPSEIDIKDKKVHPFAGIADPNKFFKTVQELGGEITLTSPFPDHHFYNSSDLQRLEKESQAHNAVLVTTEKDFVKLPDDFRRKVLVIPIEITVSDEELLKTSLYSCLTR